LLIITLFIAFYLGFRPHDIGSDTRLYYNLNKFININSILYQVEREPVYYFFVAIINFITNNATFVFLSISVALGLTLFGFMKNQINSLFLPVILVYTWGHFLFLTYNINITRQGFATIFAFLLFNNIIKHKKIKIIHFILILLATQSHFSAYILIPFYILFIITRKFHYKTISVIFFCLSLFILLVDTSLVTKNFVLIVTEYLNLPDIIAFRIEKYLDISTKVKISYGFIISILITTLFLSLGDILHDKSKKIILLGLFFYLFLFILFGYNEIFYRLTLYFWIFEFIALGNILEYYYPRSRPVFYSIVLFIPIAVFKTYFTLMKSEFFIEKLS